MPTKLEEIIAATRTRVDAAKVVVDLIDPAAVAERHCPRGFRERLQKVAQTGPAVIAELKKASPSKGLIRADFNAPKLAADLESAGAAALSVLTDEQFFQGSLHNLELASAATCIPCLRKDFIVDEFQLFEARACRADAILLIVAALEQDQLVALKQRARELQLDALVEVHDATELDRALSGGCDLIGVNNRNLHTFEVTLNTSFDLVKRIPAGVIKVAESGIDSATDIARLRDAGFDAFLIGESLMRAANPGEALRKLLVENKNKATRD
jgi:indole-3-glycerol phosphate synthase